MILPGIDLGTTYSMIAHVNAFGQPALFPDLYDANQFRTPSLVHLGRNGALIGAAAEDLLDDAADAPVARFVKAGLGDRGFGHQDPHGRSWPASALAALIFKKLARDARAFSGDELGPAVVTVPAHATDEQRRATQLAARLAGLAEVRLIEEPVAAAVYYGQGDPGAERTLLVYDFGGGTFDVSLLQVAPAGLYVLATDGDPDLGGRSIDEALMATVDDDYRRRHGDSALGDPAAAQRLRKLCEEAKIVLSRGGGAQVRRSVLLRDAPCELALTRSDLDPLVAKALDRSLQACERCLASAGLAWGDLDVVMLTGGSSLLPGVREALAIRWGRESDAVILKQPHQAVAFGAALLAERFGREPGALTDLRQVTGCDLALRVWDPDARATSLDILIPRNTPLPAVHERVLLTAHAAQDRLTLEFAQRRGSPPQDFAVGAFTFGPIAAPRLNYPVRLKVTCAADGTVELSASDDITGQALQATLQQDGDGVDPAELRRLVGSMTLSAS